MYNQFVLKSNLMASKTEADDFTVLVKVAEADRSKETCFSMASDLDRSLLKVLRSQGYWPKYSSMHRAFLCTRRILLGNCA